LHHLIGLVLEDLLADLRMTQSRPTFRQQPVVPTQRSARTPRCSSY
jgi:hypothetical protein